MAKRETLVGDIPSGPVLPNAELILLSAYRGFVDVALAYVVQQACDDHALSLDLFRQPRLQFLHAFPDGQCRFAGVERVQH